MKRLLVLAAALVPLGVTTAAWAGPVSSGALELGDHQIGTDSMVMQDNNRMSTVTHQINGEETESADTAAQPSPSEEEPRVIPEGMVVRSTSFGGLSVGVEF